MNLIFLLMIGGVFLLALIAVLAAVAANKKDD